MHGRSVGIFVCVALGVERTVFRIDAHDTLGRDGKLFVHDEGYRVADLYLARVNGLDIYDRAHMISRFHGARQHRIHLQAEHSRADKQQGYDDHYHHQNGGYYIPRFFTEFFICDPAIAVFLTQTLLTYINAQCKVKKNNYFVNFASLCAWFCRSL